MDPDIVIFDMWSIDVGTHSSDVCPFLPANADLSGTGVEGVQSEIATASRNKIVQMR